MKYASSSASVASLMTVTAACQSSSLAMWPLSAMAQAAFRSAARAIFTRFAVVEGFVIGPAPDLVESGDSLREVLGAIGGHVVEE